MSTRPFQSIAAKNRTTWSPSAKDLADRLSAHLEAEWCREDSLAGFDQLVNQVRREAKIKALRELARSIDPDAIATEWPTSEEYWAASNAASTVQKAALERADQLEQEGKNEQ